MGRTVSAGAASASQRITESRKSNRDERLHTMAGETRDHVRERLTALKERARGRALASPGGGQAARATAIAAGASTSAGSHRLESIRATRARADAVGGGQGTVSSERVAAVAARRTTMAGGTGHDRGALDDTRMLRRAGGEATGSVLASRGLAGSRTGSGALSSRAASVLASRSGSAAAGRFGSSGGSARGGGGTTTTQTVTKTETTTRSTTITAPAAAVAAAAVSTETGTATQSTSRTRPIVLAAAAVVVLAGIAVFFAVRSGSSSRPGSAAGTTPGGSVAVAPGTAGSTAPAGTQGGPGTAPAGSVAGSSQPGTATAPGAASATSGQPGTVATAGTSGVAGTTGAPGSSKILHTVQEGQSLWRISRRYYSEGHDWPTIYKENQDQIHDPGLIYPKQQFRIPAKP
jgi:nucleoid-associated protein YgaU